MEWHLGLQDRCTTDSTVMVGEEDAGDGVHPCIIGGDLEVQYRCCTEVLICELAYY